MILAKYLRYLISTTSQNWFEHEKRIEVAKSLAHSHHLIGVNYNYYSYSVTTLLSTFFLKDVRNQLVHYFSTFFTPWHIWKTPFMALSDKRRRLLVAEDHPLLETLHTWHTNLDTLVVKC